MLIQSFYDVLAKIGPKDVPENSLAQHFGIPQGTLRSYRNPYARPSLKTLQKISTHSSIPLADFLNALEDLERPPSERTVV